MPWQSSWRFCVKCRSLFYEGYGAGICAGGGGHVAQGLTFTLPHSAAATGRAQGDWRFCQRCCVMFYEGYGAGTCAAGGGHRAQGVTFTLPHSTKVSPTAQGNWRFCEKCRAMFYEGYGPGTCPAGGGHSAQGLTFTLPHSDDHRGGVTPESVKELFPFTRLGNIRENLPFVLRGLQRAGLTDPQMLNMALSTIRAEAARFVPVSEGISRFNTRDTPFDLYENRRDLGNIEPGDGARFKGRGFVQLTGRANYRRIGDEIGIDLVADPERANDGELAGRILAQFLWDHQTTIRTALSRHDLRAARRAVNGGSFGLEDFVDAFEKGQRALPGN
ncbi:glycoside hydrolase family 19 protein [Bradyrhizobium sp. 2TAF24]|uniref:glycoside hydrolase family 19 protein n=1 Tax=Bradyrhizobium sp. 2TAF24 TaxID=3233011 RepID=UPI003F909EB2